MFEFRFTYNSKNFWAGYFKSEIILVKIQHYSFQATFIYAYTYLPAPFNPLMMSFYYKGRHKLEMLSDLPTVPHSWDWKWDLLTLSSALMGKEQQQQNLFTITIVYFERLLNRFYVYSML